MLYQYARWIAVALGVVFILVVAVISLSLN